jgi:hypothetical protein
LGGGGFDEKRALCRFVILELSYKSIANRNVIIDTVLSSIPINGLGICKVIVLVMIDARV